MAAYGRTLDEMIEAVGIEDLGEALAWCEYVQLHYPPDIPLSDRWTTALADEIVAECKLHLILGVRPTLPPAVDWAREGF